jgi:ATP-dependent DNA helicase RecG
MKIGKESENLEFKKTTAELKEGVISMVAILNKHRGGELYFGIHNNGTVLGQTVSDKTLRDISQAVSNHIEPKLFPKIELVYLDDKQCIRVEFSGDETPYFAYGRAYIRVADEDKVMSPAELENYIVRKIERKEPWDDTASDILPLDIDESALIDFMERANQAKRITFGYTSKEDVLNRLNLMKDGKVKNAAVALFKGFPLLEVQMAIFATTERLTFNDIDRSGGNIAQLAAIAEKYIRNNIRWRVVLDGSLKRKEIPEIPIDAVREAIINSFCHRDYKSTQNNEIVIYSNRVEIYNPGTFPEGLTPQDFIDGKGSSVKRNPLLAQLMYYVKDIESFGTGISRISNECKTAGVKVEFEIRKLGVAVVFYRPEIHPVLDVSNGNGITENITENITESITENITESITVNKTQKMILVQMLKTPRITAKTLAEILGIADRNVKNHIKSLKQAGIIERVGPDNGGHWIVKKSNMLE